MFQSWPNLYVFQSKRSSSVTFRPQPATFAAGEEVQSPFLAPTRLTELSDAVVDSAREAAHGAEDVIATAERIGDWVHRNIRYEKGVTNTGTTAAEVHAIGAGVCQDHAHLMLAMCRSLGIRVRYVSGHLLGEGSTAPGWRS